MSLQTMYPGMNNSPKTTLASAIIASATSMTVADATVLPEAPNIAVIGTNTQAEVVIYAGKNGNVLTGLIRGAGGTTSRSWSEDTAVARNFTLLDYNNICENITELNNTKRNTADAINVASEVTGTLPVENGGTGKTSLADVKTWLGLAAMAFKEIITLTSDVIGILPIANGGTGLDASPSLLVNLASSSAADVMAASPRPGVTGKLPVANGGTNVSTANANNVFAGPSSGDAAAPGFRALAAADIPNLAASKITSGTLAVARGGTAAATASPNQVFAGPSSGSSAAAPGFRALAAADIPNLSGAKITSGTVALARLAVGGIASRPDYTISSTDIGAGATLASGTIYFVI